MAKWIHRHEFRRESNLTTAASPARRYAQCPQRPSVRILRASVFEPFTLVGHEVTKPASVRIEGIVQEAQVDSRQICQRRIHSIQVVCPDRNNQGTRVVIDAISVAAVGYRELGMLEDAGVVCH